MSNFDLALQQAIYEQVVLADATMVITKKTYMLGDLRVEETTYKDDPSLLVLHHRGSYVERPIGAFRSYEPVSHSDISGMVDPDMMTYLRDTDRSYKLLSDLIVKVGVTKTIDVLIAAGLGHQQKVHSDDYALLHSAHNHSIIHNVDGVDVFVYPCFCVIKTGNESYVGLVHESGLPKVPKVIRDAAGKALQLQ